MDNFYPKNFVLWRPQLLLLLIFLEVVFDCTGSRGPGIHAASLGGAGKGRYKDYCKEDSSCRQDLVCDSFRNMCVCRNFHSDKLALVYDRNVDKCMSAVRKLCTLDVRVVGEDDGLPRFDCVRHAECVRPVGAQLASHFGVCQCQPGWEETKEHLCRGAVVIRVGDGDPIFTSLAQKRVGMEGGLPQESVPIEEDMMSTEENNEVMGDGKKDSRIPVKALTSSGHENPNDNEGIDVPKSFIDRWVDFDFLKKSSSDAHNGGSPKSIVVLIVFIHAFAFLFQG